MVGQGRWRSNEERKKWGQRTENSSHFSERTACQGGEIKLGAFWETSLYLPFQSLPLKK